APVAAAIIAGFSAASEPGREQNHTYNLVHRKSSAEASFLGFFPIGHSPTRMRVLTITHSGKEAVGEASYHPPAAKASRSATPPLRPSRRLAVRRRALRRSTAPGTRRLPGALPRPPVRPPDHAGHLPQP